MENSTLKINDDIKGYGINENTLSNNHEMACGWKFWKKRRYIVTFLAFLGFVNLYTLRVNLSVAIVAMTAVKNSTVNGKEVSKQEFNWDSKLQGWILGSFFYGYIFTQFAGGWLAAKVGGRKVMGIGIGATAILTLLTPVLTKANVYLLLTIRILEGVFEGVTYPSIHAVWAKWAPPLERSRLSTFAFGGSYVGTVIAMPLSGFLATSLGWESIFYFFGVIALIWCFFWFKVVSETPLSDSHISKEELMYLKETLGSLTTINSKISHPWKAILTSMPVWAIIASHFGENWGFYTMLTQLPTFMKDAMQFDINGAGFMSAIPYLTMALFTPISGYLADYFLVHKILSITKVRKLFNCGAFIAQTIFMVATAYWLTPGGSTFCLSMAVGLGAFAWSGFSVNYLDIAPQHASVVMGIGNTFATIPGIVSPTITGYIVSNKATSEWRLVFFISAAIYIICCIIYGIFASGELQPWAKTDIVVNKDSSELDIDQNGLDNPTLDKDDKE